MVKLIHHKTHAKRNFQCRKAEYPVIGILFVGSVSYLLYAISTHDPDNPLCQCLLCVMNHSPEDGEYLYNRYLATISVAWISTLFGILLIVKRRIEKYHKIK